MNQTRLCFYPFEIPIVVERVGYEKQDVSDNVVRYVSSFLLSIDKSKFGLYHLEISRGLGCNPDAHIMGSKKKPLILADPLILHLQTCFEVG